MSLYLLSVWDPANPRTGLPFIMSCHAFSKVSEQGQVAGVHRHLVFHRNGEGLGREPYRDNLLSNVYDCRKSTLLQQSCSIIRFGIQFPTDHYNDPVLF